MQLEVTIIGPGNEDEPEDYLVNGFEVLDQISNRVARQVKAYLRTLAIRKSPHRASVMMTAAWVQREATAPRKRKKRGDSSPAVAE